MRKTHFIKTSRISRRPALFERCLNFLPIAVILTVLILSSSFSQNASAQSSLDKQKMAAVMNVINMYLFSDRETPIDQPDGQRVELTLPTLSSETYNATEANQVYAAFDLQEEGIEICFDIAINNGDFVVEINGDVVASTQGTDNCYQISESLQREINYVVIKAIGGGANIAIDRFELAPSYQTSANGLQKTTRGGWDERAVRKVLKIFAFGGHATDSQIQTWADMDVDDAIQEMLNFDEHNLKLSPLAQNEVYVDAANENLDLGNFRGFLSHISDPSSNLPIPTGSRDAFSINRYRFDESFLRMATVRGLNPFRQRIGFWETNHHLAVSLNASVSSEQMTEFYDLVMEAHEVPNRPYYEVMGVAAKSAAVAMQYNHRENEWEDDPNSNDPTVGICLCNDDFAREIHQLYYGIFGAGDPDHENVTIPDTAKMLTGMPVRYIEDFGRDLVVDFEQAPPPPGEYKRIYPHHEAPVDIFRTLYGDNLIAGSGPAEKIDNLMPISMQHPESLENLPIMIVSVIADDDLAESQKNQLRDAWANMGVERNFLEFIQSYAISDMFHSRSHSKNLSSHERAIYLANKRNLDNTESYTGGDSFDGRKGRNIHSIIERDFAGTVFEPLHNVFGSQTSTEASDSALAFENNYNDIVNLENYQRTVVLCDGCANGLDWEKKWKDVLPSRSNGQYYVSDVAKWLWNHAVGNMDNYTELERAHLYSILGAASIDPDGDHDGDYFFDLNLLICMIEDYKVQESTSTVDLITLITDDNWYGYDYCRSDDGVEQHELQALNAQLTGDDIMNDAELQSMLAQIGEFTLPLNATTGLENGERLRRFTLLRIDSAMDFIFTTPFIFAEGER